MLRAKEAVLSGACWGQKYAPVQCLHCQSDWYATALLCAEDAFLSRASWGQTYEPVECLNCEHVSGMQQLFYAPKMHFCPAYRGDRKAWLLSYMPEHAMGSCIRENAVGSGIRGNPVRTGRDENLVGNGILEITVGHRSFLFCSFYLRHTFVIHALKMGFYAAK